MDRRRDADAGSQRERSWGKNILKKGSVTHPAYWRENWLGPEGRGVVTGGGFLPCVTPRRSQCERGGTTGTSNSLDLLYQ